MTLAALPQLAPLEERRFSSLHPYEPSYPLEGLGVFGLLPVAITTPGTFYALYPLPSVPRERWPLIQGRPVLGGDMTRAGGGLARLPLAWLLELRCTYAPHEPEALEEFARDAEALSAWGEELGDGGAARAFVAEYPASRETLDDPSGEPPHYRYADELTKAYWTLTSAGPFGRRFPILESYLDDLRAIHARDPSYGPPLYEELQWSMAHEVSVDRTVACAIAVLESDLAINGVGLLDAVERGAAADWIVARAGAYLRTKKKKLDGPIRKRLVAAAAELDLPAMYEGYLELARAERDPFRAYVLARNAAFIYVMGTSSAPREAWSEVLRYARALGDPALFDTVSRVAPPP